MESVTRNVRDLDAAERSTVEQLVGHRLSDQQQVVIQIVGTALTKPRQTAPNELPDWCNVYEGLSDEEIADIEKSIFRCSASRSFE